MSNTLRLKVSPRFPLTILDGIGTKVRKNGLVEYIDLDYSQFYPLGLFDPTTSQILVQSTIDGSFGFISVAQIITMAQTQQVITSGTTVTVAAADGLIIINKTVGSATTVNLPASSSKIGPVKIVDWKGDAYTNNITINAVGSDKLNGNLTSWTIGADGGSIVLTPLINGTGYAV